MSKIFTPRRIYERNRWLRSDGKPNFKSTIHRVVPELYPVIVKDVPLLYPTSTILNACERISSSKLRTLPVVSPDKKLLGIINAMDIIGLLSSHVIESYFSSKIEEISIYDVVNIEVRQIMRTNPILVSVKTKLSKALEYMIINNLGSIPVVDDGGEFLGLLTEGSIVKLFCNRRFNVKVSDVMTKEVITINQDKELKDAITIMLLSGIRRLPVLSRDNKVVGVLTWRNVLDLIGKHYVFEKFRTSSLIDILRIKIGNIELSKPIVTNKDEDIGSVASILKEHDEDYALVVRDNELEGIITERDILFGMLVVSSSAT